MPPDGNESHAPPAGPLSWFRSHAIPCLLVLVAMHQFYRVQAEGLSSWRGGGFGMYAGFHPRHNEIWLIRTDSGASTRYVKHGGTQDHRRAALRPALTYVNESTLRRARNQLPGDEQAVSHLQVWQLDFDVQTMRLTRRLRADMAPETVP